MASHSEWRWMILYHICRGLHWIINVSYRWQHIEMCIESVSLVPRINSLLSTVWSQQQYLFYTTACPPTIKTHSRINIWKNNMKVDMIPDVNKCAGNLDHTWSCQRIISSVDAGMGRRVTNQRTLRRTQGERTGKKQTENVDIIDTGIIDVMCWKRPHQNVTEAASCHLTDAVG